LKSDFSNFFTKHTSETLKTVLPDEKVMIAIRLRHFAPLTKQDALMIKFAIQEVE